MNRQLTRSLHPAKLFRNRKVLFTLAGVLLIVGPALAYVCRAPIHYFMCAGGPAFWITKAVNPSTGTGGTGSAIEAEINNSNNTDPTLYATTNGKGSAGFFQISNPSDGNPAIQGITKYSTLAAIYGYNEASGSGVYGYNGGTTVGTTGAGVLGESVGGSGVVGFGSSSGMCGVQGTNNISGGYGVYGISNNGYGIVGWSQNGLAGYFDGNVQVSGSVTANSYNQFSDARLKTNISTIPSALDKITALRGVSYNWRDAKISRSTQLGFVAQEVEKVLPELVAKDKKGMRSVSYTGVIPVLVQAMKEQQKEIDSLKVQLNQQTHR